MKSPLFSAMLCSMSLTIFRLLPSINSENGVITFNPPRVSANESYESAKARLDSILAEAGQLSNAIQNRADLESAQLISGQLRQLSQDITNSVKGVREALNNAVTQLDALMFALDSPTRELSTILQSEIHRYKKSVEDAIRQEEEKRQKLAAREAEKIQHQQGLLALRDQLTAARQVADNAERFGNIDTATEIRRGIQRFATVDTNPSSFPNPHKDAYEIRKIVALALQHELEKV